MSAEPPSRVRIPELDGIRGIAILLVLVIHFMQVRGLPKPLAAVVHLGWIGVDLFFVLSGFLITGILLQSKGLPGYFRTFYRNRALRIFPLYYCVLLAILLFTAQPLAKQVMYWAYVGNYLNFTGNPIPVLWHFWSLSIEEQFYAFWPLVVLWLPAEALTAVCAGLICVVSGLRFAAVSWPMPVPSSIYTATPFRCDALLLGALVACLHHRQLLARLSWILKWAAMAGGALLALGIWLARTTVFTAPPVERYSFLGADLLFTTLIAACVIWSGARPLLPVRHVVLRFFGKYSYGIYALHHPIMMFIVPRIASRMNPLEAALTSFVVGTTLSVAAALLSWNILEKRFLSLKHKNPEHGRAMAARIH